MKKTYSSKTQAIIDLQERGYDHDFIIGNECIVCLQQCRQICPEDFEIAEAHRFDEKRRNCDRYIIYAIRSFNDDISGILMASYTTLAKGMSIHLWSKLSIELN